MKNIWTKLTRLISLCIVLMMLMFTVMSNFSYATEVNIITDETEKEKLLGINSQRAREKSILGLANEFSLFANGNVITHGSDIEGRLAANGTIDFSGTEDYNWKYQVGCGYNNYKPNTTGVSEVIANGAVKNLNVSSGATTNGNSYEATKTVVVQKLDDTDPTSEVKGWGYEDYEVDKFVKADLIDFDSEFQWLNSQSQMLANMTTNLGTVECKSVKYFVPAVYDNGNQKNMYEVVNGNIYYYYKNYYDNVTHVSYSGDGVIDYERITRNVVVFTGTNEEFNIFNITASDFNNYFSKGSNSYDYELYTNSNDIIFNVPEGSSIIINIKGEDQVKFVGSYQLDKVTVDIYDNGNGNGESRLLTKPKESVYKRTLVPYSEKDIAKDEKLKDKFGMYLYDENTRDFVRDSEGNYVLFVDIANDKQNEKAQKILYNVPEATNITLKDNILGSILAPNADATNPSDKSINNGCCGHLSGNLICKSYTGTMEFGCLPTTAQINDVKYTVNIVKLDKDTKERVSGAELQLYTLNSDKIEKTTDNINPTLLETWTSREEDKVFKLPPGGYYIVEKTAPDGFEKEDSKTYFTVEENGDINKNFNTKKELLNYNKVNLYDKINASQNYTYFNYESILPKITNLNPTYKYRTPSISFTLTTDDESLKGKEYAVHIGVAYNAFRSQSIFTTQSGGTNSNFYTQMIKYSKIKEGTETTFSIPVYGWSYGLTINLYDENGNSVQDKSKFSFTNVSANVPTIEVKSFSKSEENNSIYDKYTISIINKKVEKEPEKEPEQIPEKEPEKTPEKEPEKTLEKESEQTPEQPKDELKQEAIVISPEEAPNIENVKKEPVVITTNAPKTGDHIILYLAILGVSGIVFIITIINKIKNKKKDKKL